VNFLVDAHLPRRMTAWLSAAGCDAVHTFDLPDKNRTTDQELLDLADREQRVIVTKDSDFVDSHILNGRPAKLLLISTGNISNRESPSSRRSSANSRRTPSSNSTAQA
jgi:predicted nuclease of predicted toxin-antitoxin system